MRTPPRRQRAREGAPSERLSKPTHPPGAAAGALLLRGTPEAAKLLEWWQVGFSQRTPEVHQAFTYVWAARDSYVRNHTRILEPNVLGSHGRFSLFFPTAVPTISSTPWAAHLWDQPQQILRRLVARGHSEMCRSAKQQLEAPAWVRTWMIDEIIAGVDEMVAKAGKYADWGARRLRLRMSEEEYDEEFEEELEQDDDEAAEEQPDEYIASLPAGFWNDTIPTAVRGASARCAGRATAGAAAPQPATRNVWQVLPGHPLRELVGILYFAGAEAEELGRHQDARALRICRPTIRRCMETGNEPPPESASAPLACRRSAWRR